MQVNTKTFPDTQLTSTFRLLCEKIKFLSLRSKNHKKVFHFQFKGKFKFVKCHRSFITSASEKLAQFILVLNYCQFFISLLWMHKRFITCWYRNSLISFNSIECVLNKFWEDIWKILQRENYHEIFMNFSDECKCN